MRVVYRVSPFLILVIQQEVTVLIVLAAILAVLLITPAASAEQQTKTQEKVDVVKRATKQTCPSLRKAIVFYRGKVWGYQTKLGYHRSPTYYPERKKYACAYKQFVMTSWRGQAKEYRKEWKKYQHDHRHPKWIALDLLNGNREEWGCLMYIVSKENATMDPTLDFGHGHGNVYEAYGIPQAYPGTKMASAGPDWRTNPETQLRWMIGYCRGRYGSLCGAAYSRRVNGTY